MAGMRMAPLIISSRVKGLVPTKTCFQRCQRCCVSGHSNRRRVPESQLLLEDETTDERRLDVAIVGFPNAGKSQLLNSLVGTKVAAVSKKRHTTRNGILGVTTRDRAQLVFCDTPGFMTSPNDRKLGGDLALSAKGHMADVDYSLVVIDAAKTKLTDDYLNTISTLMWNALYSTGGKFGIVLNKVDLVKPKSKLLEAAQRFGKMADVLLLEKMKLDRMEEIPPNNLLPEVFYTCAKKGQKDPGVRDILDRLLQLAVPNREWLMPEPHDVTPMDYQAQVEEIIREKIYRNLHREVPHRIMQRNRQMELVRGQDNPSSVMIIHQDLLVRSKSHLNLLNHNGGGNLMRIHDAAVIELRRLFQCEVLLTLTAKMISQNRR